jgi:hypothetical protein
MHYNRKEKGLIRMFSMFSDNDRTPPQIKASILENPPANHLLFAHSPNL